MPVFKNMPYKIKLLVFVQVIVFVAVSVLGVVVYQKLTGLIEREMGMRASGIALASSYLVNNNMPEYLKLTSIKDEQKPFYLQMKKYFSEFKALNNLRYMYTERQIDQDKIIYILDAEPADSEYVSHIGDEDQMNDLRRQAYTSKNPEYGPLTDDPVWGKFITGYAPLINPETGEFEGLIGVDIAAAEVFKLFGELRLLIWLTILVIMAVSIMTSYKIIDLMARPMYVDGMTGTFSHKYFQERLEEEITKAERNYSSLSLLMLDFDFFKQINDTFGHRFGDIVLVNTAHIIKSICRKEDVVARYGGEEFAIVLPGIDGKMAYNIAGRLREAVSNHVMYSEEGGLETRVTISIGVAEWLPGMTKNQLIDNADRAMYISKTQNRNTVTLYEERIAEQEIATTK